jgi:TonB-linked SusC/RagA family outer membrane protein
MCNPTEVANIIRASLENAGKSVEIYGQDYKQYYLTDSEGNFVRWRLPDYIIRAGHAVDLKGPIDESSYKLGSLDSAYTLASKEGTNWMDQVYQPGLVQNYNLSATGRSDKGQYALTFNYFDQEGVVKYTGYSRYSLRVNTLFNIKNRVRIGENLGFSWHRYMGSASDRIMGWTSKNLEIEPLYDIAGNYTVGSWLASLERGKDNYNDYFRLLGSFFIEIDILNDLTFKTSFSPNIKATFEHKVYSPKEIEDPEPNYSQLNQFINNSFNWTWYNTLVYNKTFSDKHSLQIMIGTETIEDKTTWHTVSRAEFFSDAVPYRHLSTGEQTPQVSGLSSEWSIFSLFGKIDYVFNNKYIISGTIRRDGSSRFGEGNKYALFPAFSAAWRLGNENFMGGISFINDLKLRIGWGQTGNQNIGNYRTTSAYSTDIFTANYDITGSQNTVLSGIQSTIFGNPNAKWETTTTTNAGIDLIVLNNSLELTFDWYIRETSDLLLQVPPIALAGQAKAPYYNIGDMKNTGIDFSLLYSSPKYGDFSWGAGINLTHYKNEVTKLIHEDQIYWGGRSFLNESGVMITKEGYPISSFYGMNILGIYQNEEEVLNGPKYVFGHWDYIGDDTVWVAQPQKGVGRWIFQDKNGNDSIDYDNPLSDDRIILGSPHPDFTFGVPINFYYRGIYLNMFWYGSIGNEIYHHDKNGTDFLYIDGYLRNEGIFSKRMLQSWGMIEDNTDAILPQISDSVAYIAPVEYRKDISYYIEDGSFLRLSQLIVGYHFNCSRWKAIEKFNIYFQANNLLTITNYQGMDPEVTRDESGLYEFENDFDLGWDRGQYPNPMSFLFGFNITF